jgi:hypothetical protein
MTPVPEPAGDIRAQLQATLDPTHPKRACFLVPGDAEHLKLDALPEGAYAAVRPEGTLITADKQLAEFFETIPSETRVFDTAMAGILGLTEVKPLVRPLDGRAVQARDAQGHVIIETFVSPTGLLDACAEMQRHVPPGGELVILGSISAIARRIAMRWVDNV